MVRKLRERLVLALEEIENGWRFFSASAASPKAQGNVANVCVCNVVI